tara:strand:- start:24 stop:1526 length:1503 start_codon:yes stop_codon:yes gene_type:complete
MRDIEEILLNSPELIAFTSTEVERLFAFPLGQSTSEFRHHPTWSTCYKIGAWWSDTDFSLWLHIEKYLAEPEIQQENLKKIGGILARMTPATYHLGSKKSGTRIQPNISPELLRQIYNLEDAKVTNLLQMHVTIPPSNIFNADQIPACILSQEKKVQETLKQVNLKTLEPFILKVQRTIRKKQRQQEEINRIARKHRDRMADEEIQDIQTYINDAKILMQDANTPYTPQCEEGLAERIMLAAQKLPSFSEIKHITSTSALQSILDDALYGSRSLSHFYLSFNKAALSPLDISNGDGNAVCLGTQDIDPQATGDITLKFNLEKIIQTKPSAFYKQADFGYLLNRSRTIKLGNTPLFFNHTSQSRRDPEKLSFRIVDCNNRQQQTSELSNEIFIAYDLSKMHLILTLNFFRCIDSLQIAYGDNTNYRSDFYEKVGQLTEDELVCFLESIKLNFTDTMEFNFYGSHQIDFFTVETISSKINNYTLNLFEFIKSLNEGSSGPQK